MFAPRTTPQRSFYMNRKPASVPAAFKTTSNTTSPNSSTSGSSSITPQRSHGRSASSKGSTTSTLTPSPSPTPGKVGYHQYPSVLSWLCSSHRNNYKCLIVFIYLIDYSTYIFFWVLWWVIKYFYLNLQYGEDPNRVLSSLHENDGSTDGTDTLCLVLINL